MLSKKKKKMTFGRVPIVAQCKQISVEAMRFQVQSLALLIGLRFRCYHELWCSLQTQLGSGVAVSVV